MFHTTIDSYNFFKGVLNLNGKNHLNLHNSNFFSKTPVDLMSNDMYAEATTTIMNTVPSSPTIIALMKSLYNANSQSYINFFFKNWTMCDIWAASFPPIWGVFIVFTWCTFYMIWMISYTVFPYGAPSCDGPRPIGFGLEFTDSLFNPKPTLFIYEQDATVLIDVAKRSCELYGHERAWLWGTAIVMSICTLLLINESWKLEAALKETGNYGKDLSTFPTRKELDDLNNIPDIDIAPDNASPKCDAPIDIVITSQNLSNKISLADDMREVAVKVAQSEDAQQIAKDVAHTALTQTELTVMTVILVLNWVGLAYAVFIVGACSSGMPRSDAPQDFQMKQQDPATDVMEWMLDLHDMIMADLIVIVIIISYLLWELITNPIHHTNSNKAFSHSTFLEIFWTVIPALILITIAYPSFNLLYALDDLTDPAITLKVIGHQWYWSYEYNLYDLATDRTKQLCFDSYILNTDELAPGMFRLLEADNRVILPVNVHIRLLITSADVLHSWAIPSFGIKVDACPGRLTQATLMIKRPGIYFGQCSEICGVNHGFMPITVLATDLDQYNTHDILGIQSAIHSSLQGVEWIFHKGTWIQH